MKFADPVGVLEGDKAGLLALFLGDQDHIVSLEEVFFRDEGHDILRVPGESAGFHVIDLVGRFCAVDGFAAVEDGGGAVVVKEGDGLAGGVHLGEGLSCHFAGTGEHDAGGGEKGKECVDGDGGAADFFKARGEVFVQYSGQNRERKKAGKGVGGVLGRDEFEEDVHDDEVNEEELGRVRCAAEVELFAFPFLKEAVGDGEAPWGKADEVDDEVEVPFVLRRMLGDGGAEEVVDTEEVQEEIGAVKVAHETVPGTGDRSEEEKSGEKVDALHFAEVFVVSEEEEGGKAGKEEADGAFGEDGEGSGDVAEVVVFPVFAITQVEESDRHAHEEEEGRVGDDGFREKPALDGGAKDDGGEPADFFVVDTAGEPVGEEDGGAPEKGGGQAGCHFIEAEERVGKCQLPVVKDGLVVPVVSVDLWGDPVAGENHFLRGDGVVGLGGVGDGEELVADEVEEEGTHEKREVGVLAKRGVHRASLGKYRSFVIHTVSQGDEESCRNDLRKYKL